MSARRESGSIRNNNGSIIDERRLVVGQRSASALLYTGLAREPTTCARMVREERTSEPDGGRTGRQTVNRAGGRGRTGRESDGWPHRISRLHISPISRV